MKNIIHKTKQKDNNNIKLKQHYQPIKQYHYTQ